MNNIVYSLKYTLKLRVYVPYTREALIYWNIKILMEKVIKASVIGLTKNKRELLDNDYFNYQWWMIFGVDKGLLSAFKSYKSFKQKIIKYRAYHLPLQHRFIKDWFRERNTKLTKHWIKIPNSRKKGIGLWLPLKFHQELPKNYKLRDSFLVRKDNKYYIHFVIDIPEPKMYKPKTLHGIDLGLKNPVALTDIKTKETIFLGRDLKKVKGKYFYLRKKLGKEKNIRLIKKIRNKEKNKVNSILHKISKEIVNNAYKKKAVIVIGKLKDLKKNKGRKFNRKLSGFSHYKLTKYIEYKAREKGVPFIAVPEYNTSKTCNVCGIKGEREKNWFKCNCGYEDNADRNAAFNIAKRGLSYMLKLGVNAFAQKPIIKLNGQAHKNMQVCNLY